MGPGLTYTVGPGPMGVAKRPPSIGTAVLLAMCTAYCRCYTTDMSEWNNYNRPTGVPTLARDLRRGDRFVSDRPSEGIVEVLYDYGTCPHDERPESVFVKEAGTRGDGITSASWFIAIPSDWKVHLTEVGGQ